MLCIRFALNGIGQHADCPQKPLHVKGKRPEEVPIHIRLWELTLKLRIDASYASEALECNIHYFKNTLSS